MEEKGLSKFRKDKDHGTGLDPLQSLGGFPCAVCRTSGQQHHLLKQLQALGAQDCRELKCLAKDPDYRCTQCQGTASGLDGRQQRKVQDKPIKLGKVASSCYLGDMFSAGDGCELSITTRVKTAWKKFKELLPVLFPPPLFHDAWPRVQLLCAECNAPCQ